tara:strand:- start:4496 stop:5185 length:690 start_codon:yes stop_codon:yes gene_type:complete
MTEQMPSFLSPQSNGTESVRYDRLYYKIQPEPHFALKKSDSDLIEKVKFEKLGLDLSNMNIGFVKWVGTTPSKVMNNALDSLPPKPQGDGWNNLYELKVYSVNNLSEPMFFDVTNWGGQRGIQQAFRDYLDYCKKNNITWQNSKTFLPIFLYTGTRDLKNKEGKVTSAEPVFKLERVIQNPKANANGHQPTATQVIDGGTVDDISEIPQRIEEIKQGSSISALKGVKQL